MRRIMQSLRRLYNNQKGMVSILTVMIMIIVISLIVLGFAQLSRRNQRESLDRQQSTQAFYAAETGLNDARDLIAQKITAGVAIVDKTDCTGTGSGGYYSALTPVIDAAKGVSYSCLLVDAAPSTLQYTGISTRGTVVPIASASGAALSTVTFTWTASGVSTPLTGCPASTNNVFVPTNAWNCGYGVVRLDLVPTAGTFNPDTLRNATMTSFMVPLTAGGDPDSTIPYSAGNANTNARVGVNCTNTQCRMTISGLSQNSYYLRLNSLYKKSDMRITATDGTGATVRLSGAQAIIDVTGKAQDVLRRLQAHVPLANNGNNAMSDFALQTADSVCKRFSVMDGYFDNDSAAEIPAADADNASRLCRTGL